MGFWSAALEDSAKTMSSKLIEGLCGYLFDKFNEHQVLSDKVFYDYISNAKIVYNRFKNIINPAEPRAIVGENSIYSKIPVCHNDSNISTETVEEMLKISNNILLVGSGGAGKTMLMRYLF